MYLIGVYYASTETQTNIDQVLWALVSRASAYYGTAIVCSSSSAIWSLVQCCGNVPRQD